MELHGSVVSNLKSALQSARKLRGQPVHPDTLAHWSEVLQYARDELATGSAEPVLGLCKELERELAHRRDPPLD